MKLKILFSALMVCQMISATAAFAQNPGDSNKGDVTQAVQQLKDESEFYRSRGGYEMGFSTFGGLVTAVVHAISRGSGYDGAMMPIVRTGYGVAGFFFLKGAVDEFKGDRYDRRALALNLEKTLPGQATGGTSQPQALKSAPPQ